MEDSKPAAYIQYSGQKRPASSSRRANPGPNRSVNDFESEDQLRDALLSFDEFVQDPDCRDMLRDIAEGEPVQKAARVGERDPAGEQVIEHLDWVLPKFEAATTESQSMDHELRRLQTLRRYLILDSEREEAFERITSLASRIFDVPIALVSLVDVGRQWFMSSHGLGDVRETPRKMAFCSHAILNKNNILIVPDAHLDFRFVDNPLVTGPPHIRFYAGSPLISPEGDKLGTFCVIDSVPRPQGLNQEQQDTLRDLADMTVKVLVDRRFQLEKKEQSQTIAPAAQMIANTAHDLMTPLTGLQLSLSLLKDDEEVRAALGEHRIELLYTAASCSDLMVRICEHAVAGLRLTPGVEGSTSDNNSNNSMLFSGPVLATGSGLGMTTTPQTETRVPDLVKSLHMIVEPIATKVPLIVVVDPTTPSIIVADDLKIFRAALNFLNYAVQRTVIGTVRLTIRPVEDTLLFECEDTGADIPVEEYQFLFQPCRPNENDTSSSHNLRVGLSSVASLIEAMGGEYGFRPRGIAADGSILHDSKGRRRSGSVFWFSIPLIVPQAPAGSLPTPIEFAQQLQESGNLPRVGSSNNVANKRTPLVVGDIFQADAIQGSCLSAAFSPSVPPSYEMSQTSIGDNSAKMDSSSARKTEESGEDIGAQEMDMSSSSEKHRKATARRRHALVIDDSLVIRKILERALNKLGFEVSLAVDGMEGLEKLKESMYDLVLCDFLMPVMDGMDCVKQYRDWEEQNRSWFRQFIVGMSAHANINDSGQGKRAGMDSFESKPITVDTLMQLQASDECFSRTQQLDELEREQRKRSTADDDILPIAPQSIGIGVGVHGMPGEIVCLLASDLPSTQPNPLKQELQSHGWKVVTVNDGTDCLRLLQMRNWDVVLIEDELPQLPGASCILAFREWEGKNRVNRQKNVFLVCEGVIPSPVDKLSLVQPPEGCNGVLGRPVPWKDLQLLLHPKDGDRGMDIVVR